LRGLAALAVAIGHGFAMLPNGRIEDPAFILTPTNALLAAGEIFVQPNTAVVVFYVLSGFVLGEAFRRDRSASLLLHTLAFAVRRLWRLFPVMWLSIVLSAAILIAIPHSTYAGATGWFNNSLDVEVSIKAILANAMGLSHSINAVLWSVQIELWMIVLLPLMVGVCKQTSIAGDYAIVCILCAASIFGWNTLWNCILFAYCFYLGILLPKVLSDESALRLLGNGGGLAVSLALLLPVELLYASQQLGVQYKFIADALISFHVIAFLVLRPDSRAISILRPLVWLGDVSYSFYCYAFSILIALGSLSLAIVPAHWLASNVVATAVTLLVTMSSILISLVLAKYSFERVEKPAIKIGSVWSKRIEASAFPSSPRPRHQIV
jgi:peptidoglycan/LPS O-acetylase OafA/YrhL